MSELEKPQEEPKIIEQTPEEELQQIKKDEIWIKEQIMQPDSVLRNLYSTDAPKKDFIVFWAMKLERRYDLELQLDQEPIVKSVGSISTYIKAELTKMKVHRSTLHYVHKVLGVKYKYEKYDHRRDIEGGTESLLNSSNTIADFEQENQPILEMIVQQKQFLHHLENKAKSSRILSALNPQERLRYEENNLRIQATQLLASQIIDDRQSVPIYAQLKLVMAVVASTNNYAADMYVSQIKQFGANKMHESEDFFKKTSSAAMEIFSDKNQKLFQDTFKNIKKLRTVIQKIEEKKKEKAKKNANKKRPVKPPSVMTSKQAMKTVFGMVKKVLSVFDPKHRDDAILDGCYGISCPECGSFRVREREHPDSHEWLCFCYNCEWWMEAKTVTKCRYCHLPFFEEILEVIMKTAEIITNKKGEPIKAMKSQCPKCEEPLTLPAKMFQAPKLRGN